MPFHTQTLPGTCKPSGFGELQTSSIYTLLSKSNYSEIHTHAMRITYIYMVIICYIIQEIWTSSFVWLFRTCSCWLFRTKEKSIKEIMRDRVIMTCLQFLHSWNWNMLWDLLSSNDLLPSVQWFSQKKKTIIVQLVRNQDHTQTQFTFYFLSFLLKHYISLSNIDSI